MSKIKFARLNIIVEGHTEEEFVGTQIAEHLGLFNVSVVARRVETGRRGSKIYRGGMTNYSKAEGDIRKWLSQDRGSYLTTFFDLYALPRDFPGHAASKNDQTGASKARTIEREFLKDINDHRFIPFVQPYEFEALLFSDVVAIDNEMQLSGPSKIKSLQAEIAGVNPEDLNDSPITAPSKRLLRIFPTYDKVFHGPKITSNIGLPAMRDACPHFDEWLSRLEQLA